MPTDLPASGFALGGLFVGLCQRRSMSRLTRSEGFQDRHSRENFYERSSPNGIALGVLPVRLRKAFATAAPVIGTPISPAPLG